jgi:DNA topoisomerase-1
MMSSNPSPQTLSLEPQLTAEQAQLQYVGDDEPGYRRQPWGRGFTYFDPAGNRVRDKELRAYFESLVIPPAWTEVWICTRRKGHIQATGRDDKGRKQYIYHPRWEEQRTLTKFNQMRDFAQCLPLLRAQVDRDLRRHHLTREKVTAIVIRVLEGSLIRIGNSQYARRNHSYGLTTLLDDHLEISGTHLHFSFPGKGGQQQEIDIRDRRVANLLQRCQELPGQHLFQYRDEAGERHSLTSDDVNQYLQEVTGQPLTAKSFRTWGGTVLAAVELNALGPSDSEAKNNPQVVNAVKRVAAGLGNTPAICRQYYIHPAIIQAYLDHTLFEAMQAAALAPNDDPHSLSIPEQAIATLLEAQAD